MSSNLPRDSTDEGTNTDRNIGDGQVRLSIPIEIAGQRSRVKVALMKEQAHMAVPGRTYEMYGGEWREVEPQSNARPRSALRHPPSR